MNSKRNAHQTFSVINIYNFILIQLFSINLQTIFIQFEWFKTQSLTINLFLSKLNSYLVQLLSKSIYFTSINS